MQRSLKHELWLLQNKLPQAWEHVIDKQMCCPPDRDKLTDVQEAMYCFSECKYCWEKYFEDENRQ